MSFDVGNLERSVIEDLKVGETLYLRDEDGELIGGVEIKEIRADETRHGNEINSISGRTLIRDEIEE